MSAFITGLLTKNARGAHDPSEATTSVDRWLTVRLRNGQEIEIFDNGVTQLLQPISGAVPPGHVYTFLLSSLAKDVKLVADERQVQGHDKYKTGLVVNPDWRAPVKPYICFVVDLPTVPLVLLETSLGLLVIAKKRFQAYHIEVGTKVSWKETSLALLAIESDSENE